MIIKERFPWYMATTGAVGAIGLITGIGTLAASFEPLFGVWAWGAAALIDLLALTLTVWAIQAVRSGVPAGLVRTCAHVCIGVSVLAQAVTAFQGLSGTVGGWTSALMHTVPPLILGLALELIYRHYATMWRRKVAPAQAAEVMREQLANAAVGRPVHLSKVQKAVVAAARANVLDMRALAHQLADDDLANIPAMRTLYAVVDPQGAAELEARRIEQASITSEHLGVQSTDRSITRPVGFDLTEACEGQGLWGPEQAERSVERSNIRGVQAEQGSVRSGDDLIDDRSADDRCVRAHELRAAGLSIREISRALRCSPSTVSSDLKNSRGLREVI
jgi:hypothetical protein